MSTFIGAFILFIAAFTGLAVGIITRRRPLRGGCGGYKGLGERLACTHCERKDGVRGVTVIH